MQLVVYTGIHVIIFIFLKYLETCLAKLVKENKELYICGDFNFDLLKIDTDHLSQHFSTYFVVMVSLQPTRVTENTATIIDNIFSNNVQEEIISGTV